MASYEKIFNQLTNQISLLTQSINDIKPIKEQLKPIYTNESLMELLGIGKDLIRKYRDDGDIGYTNVGDKYWYTSDDVMDFLKKNHRKPFAYKRYQ